MRTLRIVTHHQTCRQSRVENCDQQLMEEMRKVCRLITGKLKEKIGLGGGGGVLVIYRQK